MTNNKLQIQSGLTAESAKAIEALRAGKVPASAIKTHPGKGGKTFSYVSHIHGSKTLNDAFDQTWDWEVLKWELFDDKSAVAQGSLTIHFFSEEGRHIHARRIVEIGPFEDLTGKFSKANIVASAASRSLIRCMLRAFDYGAELYKDEESGMTDVDAWKLLKDAGKKNGLVEDELVELFRTSGFEKDKLVERFEDAWKMVYEKSQQRKAEREEETLRLKKERAEAALANEKTSSKLAIGAAMKAKGRKVTEAKEVIGDLADRINSSQNVGEVKNLTKQAVNKIAELPDPQPQ